MLLNFDILTNTSSHEEPHLWLAGCHLNTASEQRNLFLLTESSLSDDSRMDEFNIFLSLNKAGRSCHFLADTNLDHGNKSFLRFSIFRQKQLIFGAIHLQLILKRDEILFLAQKLDTQKLLGRENSVSLEVETLYENDKLLIGFFNENSKSIQNGVTKSHEIEIVRFKLISK